MNAPSYDIYTMLEDSASGVNLTLGTNLFVGSEPSLPKNCVTIFDTASYPPYLSIKGEVGYEYPSVQIRVRNSNYINGWNLINNIKDALHGKHWETWNDSLYTIIACVSGPALLDWDDNNNCRFVITLNMQRRSA